MRRSALRSRGSLPAERRLLSMDHAKTAWLQRLREPDMPRGTERLVMAFPGWIPSDVTVISALGFLKYLFIT